MNKIIFAAVFLIAVIGLGFWFGFFNVHPASVNEMNAVTIVTTEVRDLTAETNDGGVHITLSDGETRFIAPSDPLITPVDPLQSDTYRTAVVSPNAIFVAVEGIGFEEAFVRVYDVETDTLHEKIYGEITGWTSDGLLQIDSCNLADENCVEKISVSAVMPWNVQVVPGTERNVTSQTTYRDNFTATDDFISNIHNADNLSRFAAILDQVRAEAITGTGPFTVFVPTNDALAETNTFDDESLIDLVQQHVVASEYEYADFTVGKTIETIGLDELNFQTKAGKVLINEAAYIVDEDIQSSNGVIHIIDALVRQ